jgi:hypothetical protein
LKALEAAGAIRRIRISPSGRTSCFVIRGG